MRFLADTNVVLRAVHSGDANYAKVRRCLNTLFARGDEVCYAAQNLVEFWNVSTRPTGAPRSGYGLSVSATDQLAQNIEREFTFLPDGRDVHDEWRRLVVLHNVSGVQVFDARLAATMIAHGVAHLLTLNGADFKRFPLITSVAPDDVNAGRA